MKAALVSDLTALKKTTAKVSFQKESLMQGKTPEEETFEEDYIELQEGDVTRTVTDGLISIEFSEWVQELARKSFEHTIILKLLGRRIGYTTLPNKLYDLWKPKNAFKLMDINNDYFLAIFKTESDHLNALANGPWTIFGHYLTVEPWSASFSTSQHFPSMVWTWIRLPGLPTTLYKHNLITTIGEYLGPFVKIDYQAERGRRGRSAWMIVKVDLRKPLISKLVINGNIQIVEYESLPTVRFKCGKYRHLQDSCPDATIDIAENVIPPESQQMDSDASRVLSDNKSSFGPWMVVERRQRRIKKKPIEPPTAKSNGIFQVSRFSPIYKPENETVNATPTHASPRPTTTAKHPVASSSMQKPKPKSKGVLRNHLLFESTNYDIPSLVTMDGNWDIVKLPFVFTNEAISHILSVKPPNSSDAPDKIIWRWTKKYNFEVNSAYSCATNTNWNAKHPIWNLIWRLQVPQRIRLFIWLVFQERIMTNVERYRRSIG
ncbi:hypothetical protein V6N11_008121 [Hibiscus sabdariffa]|uniref:DUF4283 domain-containing protein n=1 Tax=Hibiscus sabdariffa TaxID=183260 RepID=A0ABR2PZP4_9ROSI